MSGAVQVDVAVCQGYASCVVTAPEVFDIDPDDGVAVVNRETVTDAETADVERAIAICPVAAISWIDR